MSLVRIGLRIAAVEAIRGRTLVGDNVLDSPNGALDIIADGSLRTEEDRPFIGVFTEQGKAQVSTGRGLFENGTIELVFDIGQSSAMLETNEETGETVFVGINIPASDRSSEFFLDMVERQINDALCDPDNQWAEIFRGLSLRIVSTSFAGARSTEGGQKVAGHQLRLMMELIADPVRGDDMPDNSPFLRLLAAMEGSSDGVYHKQAAIMRAAITGTDEPWQAVQRWKGMTASELLALGLGPLAQDEDRSTPALTEAVIAQAGVEDVTVGGA